MKNVISITMIVIQIKEICAASRLDVVQFQFQWRPRSSV